MSARRLFFALWPDATTAESLCGAARVLGLTAGRALADADLHVTLCFLGAVDDTAIPGLFERAAAVRADPFKLEFDRLEYWRQSRVLAATCSRIPLAAQMLAQALRASAQSIGLMPDEHPLQPHVTLVRGLGGAHAPVLEPTRLAAPLSLAARVLYLAQSQELEAVTASGAAPARYRRLGSWPLRAMSD